MTKEIRARSVRASALGKMDTGTRAEVLQEMVQRGRSVPVERWLDQVNADIRIFEAESGMDSTEMLRRLAVGEISETSTVCDWLMALGKRDRLQERQRALTA